MKTHLIAIGGSAMHNLAIALHRKGIVVTGSDDEIFEPSKSRLNRDGLLPESEGWFPEKITKDLGAVIVGMHARRDNPELLRAQELGLKIFSYPEYLYEQTKDKIRIVIGGSHGKTSTTAMILHVMQHCGIATDYMVGAQLDGFDCMVKLTSDNKYAVLEGDEYLSSPIDPRPKFHLYRPDIALLTGIAWDHINVFPTFENYVEQFKIFVDLIEKDGSIVYCSADSDVVNVVKQSNSDIKKVAYDVHPHVVRNGITYLLTDSGEVPLKIFGNHNLQNLNGALMVCHEIGIGYADFYDAIKSFGGAARRLEVVKESSQTSVYKDFAHSPSKLTATTSAVKQQFPDRKLIACMELHTFSSLNAKFLNEYDGAMVAADEAIVYFNPHTIAHKKLEPITEQQVQQAFGTDNVKVFTNSNEIVSYLMTKDWNNSNLLLMTSGNFDGVDFADLANKLVSK
jgi:UDP-N-acetylmuramate: L-alanyl-gamma-D-glutamyl-meso-diaminopimelate ligase